MTLQSFVSIPGVGRVPFDFLPSGAFKVAVAVATVRFSYRHLESLDISVR